jgi:hypothetical protein
LPNMTKIIDFTNIEYIILSNDYLFIPYNIIIFFKRIKDYFRKYYYISKYQDYNIYILFIFIFPFIPSHPISYSLN